MKRPVLVIMAAGMGSRYGGLKQIDPIDREGHIIIDFSIYDARRAGFEKVVFIIKKDNEEEFKEVIGNRISKFMDVAYAFQELSNIPENYQVPDGRKKPWGTAHAVLSAADKIDGPFAVINADDYYGYHAFSVIYNFLTTHEDTEKYSYTMVGYRLKNTVTDNGDVSRGICTVTQEGKLVQIVERTQIEKRKTGIVFTEDKGQTWEELDGETLVSMNMWGFTPDYFKYSDAYFKEFLSDPKNMENLKAEFFIPLMVNKLIQEGTATVKVLDTTSKWFGVTYAADRQDSVDRIQSLVDQDVYPNQLF